MRNLNLYEFLLSSLIQIDLHYPHRILKFSAFEIGLEQQFLASSECIFKQRIFSETLGLASSELHKLNPVSILQSIKKNSQL
jgi:hypothetical protein